MLRLTILNSATLLVPPPITIENYTVAYRSLTLFTSQAGVS